MTGNADRDRATDRGDQLLDSQMKLLKVESSLHSAQMLLLDTVDTLTDQTFTADDRQRAVEKLHGQIREYLMSAAWVLPPDQELLGSLSLLGADEGGATGGEDPAPPSAGDVRCVCGPDSQTGENIDINTGCRLHGPS